MHKRLLSWRSFIIVRLYYASKKQVGACSLSKKVRRYSEKLLVVGRCVDGHVYVVIDVATLNSLHHHHIPFSVVQEQCVRFDACWWT